VSDKEADQDKPSLPPVENVGFLAASKESGRFRLTAQSFEYDSPVLASEFEIFERAVSGAGNRILVLWEREVDHRHKEEQKEAEHCRREETKETDASIRLGGRGQIFAFALSCLSITAIVAIAVFSPQPVWAIAPAGILIASLGSMFIGRKK